MDSCSHYNHRVKIMSVGVTQPLQPPGEDGAIGFMQPSQPPGEA
jgi:hypothetical protein